MEAEHSEEPIRISPELKERLREIVFNGELKAIIDSAVADEPDLSHETQA